jgi:hypothetical protein
MSGSFLSPPPDQTQRQIGFYLAGGAGPDLSFTFGLRPEDLSQTEPMRLTVQQTLGGAWADAFDRGVASITLSGTTGWRGTSTQSGEDMFQYLRSTVFQAWADNRTQAISAGQDPSSVQLFLTDSLDSICALVAPKAFTLHRSKSSPLMMRYNIQLIVLADASEPQVDDDPILDALSDPTRWIAAVVNLQNIMILIPRFLVQAAAALGSAFAIVTTFVNTGLALVGTIVAVAQDTAGQFVLAADALLSTGILFAQAAAAGFSILADDATLLIEQVLPLQALASVFTDIVCTCENGFNLVGVIATLDGFRGASNCSSTGGGDPASPFTLQDVTPFAYAIPSAAPLVQVTAGAALAMAALTVDPLTLVGQQGIVVGLMDETGQGITVDGGS